MNRRKRNLRLGLFAILTLIMVCCVCPAFLPRDDSSSETTEQTATREIVANQTVTSESILSDPFNNSPDSTPGNTPVNTRKPTFTPRPTRTPVPTRTLSPEGQLLQALKDELGASNRTGVQRVTVDLVDGVIFIKFAIQDNFSNRSIRQGMTNDVFAILHVIDQSGLTYTDVSIQGTFPLRDAYGNVSEQIVMAAGYSQETIGRINFDGIVEVFTIADETPFFHQALLED